MEPGGRKWVFKPLQEKMEKKAEMVIKSCGDSQAGRNSSQEHYEGWKTAGWCQEEKEAGDCHGPEKGLAGETICKEG